jgi:hypothetical protein
MVAALKILPGTGRGTMRSMVEGARCHAPSPLHHRLRRRFPSPCRGGSGNTL